MRIAAIALVMGFLLNACGGGGSPPATAGRPPEAVPSGTVEKTADVGGRTRTWRVYVPPGVTRGEPVPVLYALHGRLGTGVNTQTTYGFDGFADARRFVVVYPDGIGRSWNDGRPGTPAAEQGVDDLAFFDAIDADLRRWIDIDDRRIFACGMSNGGIMTHRLAFERASRFAAIGAVCGNLSEATAALDDPPMPVSCVLVAGTADPLVPWEGGDGTGNGPTLAATATSDRYRARNGTGPTVEAAAPDADPSDGATATLLASDGGAGGSAVHLWRIDGGGHTWPGRRGTLDVGPLCRDVDATALIVEFLLAHPRQWPPG